MLREALDRTLLLMRTDLVPGVCDDELVAALTSTRVVLAAGPDTLRSQSGQSAVITAAMLMARSGHDIWLAFEDAPLLVAQPPLVGATIRGALLEVGDDLMPGLCFRNGSPHVADVAVEFGDAAWNGEAPQRVRLNATDWSASLALERNRWSGDAWPVGGMAAAAVAAGEAFKSAMRKLAAHARSPGYFNDLYAPATEAVIETAPEGAPLDPELGTFDLISGGAIGNAALYVLLGLPGVSGAARVFDDDRSALSNLNRNALLRRSRLELFKVEDLASYETGLKLLPEPVRYDDEAAAETQLAETVLVGVDDIPSRWRAQAAGPAWLGVGATDGFAVQVSFHAPGLACAQCLHPEANAPAGAIPTVAFVSFWSGLLLAVQLLRRGADAPPPPNQQQAFFTALRPESWPYAASPVPVRPHCPQGCGRPRSAAAASGP